MRFDASRSTAGLCWSTSEAQVIKVSEYIARRVAELGVSHVFMVTGGGAMHLDDSFGRRTDLKLVFCHHEQACAIAAEGYARITGRPGVVCVTSGPGGTNAVTGVLGQWHDSVPALYLSGQVRSDTTVALSGLPLRQLGDQEAPIVEIVRPITKYAAMVVDPASIGLHFDAASALMTTGRPGPVWLDVPVDVQGALVDEADIERGRHAAPPVRDPDEEFDRDLVRRQIAELVERLGHAARPVLLAGSGVRTAGAADVLLDVVSQLAAPAVTAWNAHDLLWEGHPLYAGRPGTVGDRAGNFAVQNADLLLSVGCRLNIRQIGYERRAFAPQAFKAVVDIDALELRKPTVSPDLAVHSDARFFLEELGRALRERWGATRGEGPRWDEWVAWCLARRLRYPVVLPDYRVVDTPVNPYVFVDELSDRLEGDEIVVCANGAACVVGFQALRVQRGQRLIANSGTAGMGYDLPAAIGACFGSGGKRVVCLAGDGSIQMNLQELQTIAHHRLPVKIFVFDNSGYLSIRQTQDNLFEGHRVGESAGSGVSFPDMVAVAQAYGLAACRVDSHTGLAQAISATLAVDGPALCDVVMSPEQQFAPKASAERLADGRIVSKPLEDMWPFLERSEFSANMFAAAQPPRPSGIGD
jgi:acetolactate synthase-1/2/3 large subunit